MTTTMLQVKAKSSTALTTVVRMMRHTAKENVFQTKSLYHLAMDHQMVNTQRFVAMNRNAVMHQRLIFLILLLKCQNAVFLIVLSTKPMSMTMELNQSVAAKMKMISAAQV